MKFTGGGGARYNQNRHARDGLKSPYTSPQTRSRSDKNTAVLGS